MYTRPCLKRAVGAIRPLTIGLAVASLVISAGGVRHAIAQTASSEIAKTIDDAKKSQPALQATIDKRTGLPTRIRGVNINPDPLRALVSGASAPSEADVRHAVEAFFAQSMLKSAFPQSHPSAKRVIQSVKPDPTIPGQYVADVRQEVGGIPVFGSSGKVAVGQNLAITGLTASFSPADVTDITATVSMEDAITKARAELKTLLAARSRPSFGGGPAGATVRIDTAAATAEQTVFDPKLVKKTGDAGASRLAWLVSIDNYRLFIDAKDSTLLYFFQDYRSLTIRRVFDLAGTEQVPLEPVLDDSVGQAKEPLSTDAKAAFENIGAVRDFYLARFGRSSFDDPDGKGPKTGSPIEAFVRYGTIAGAHWCPSTASGCPRAQVGVYGTGFAKALDVVGHEFTHGVISFEAKLVYLDEPGAVNEALADIMGTLIELNARGAKGNWLVGEDLPSRSVNAPERSLAEPMLKNASGQQLFARARDYDADANRGQPDHYSELVKRTDPLCESTSDYFNGCVHFNSGILNKFAYLVAVGGEHHGVTVTGIGADKLGHMAYRSITSKLNQTSGLVDAANAFVDSCYDFLAANVAGFVVDDCKAVEAAQKAVGLAELPS